MVLDQLLSYQQLCQVLHNRANRAIFWRGLFMERNSANCAKKWRDFREIWRSLEPKVASKVLAYGTQNRYDQ